MERKFRKVHSVQSGCKAPAIIQQLALARAGSVTPSVEALRTLGESARWSVMRLAQLCGRSARQLRRDFHSAIACGPRAWLNEVRMEIVKRRALAGEPVKAIALELGFRYQSHLCRQFKAFTGMTPREFASRANPLAYPESSVSKHVAKVQLTFPFVSELAGADTMLAVIATTSHSTSLESGSTNS
jgi:AraC-like DNA-binding protein